MEVVRPWVARLFVPWLLFALVDTALVFWMSELSTPLASGRPPIAFAGLALAIGRHPPPHIILASLALMGSGAVARSLLGQPAPALVWSLGIASLVLVAGLAIARLRAGPWSMGLGLALIAAALLVPLGRWPDVRAAPALGDGPSVSVLSSVPLGIAAQEEGRLVRQALERVGPVVLLDAVPLDGPSTDRLLLLQPRALTGEEMVALDEWVRRGGHVVILDDPQFDWRGDGPLGHSTNPLVTSLLDPLLAHWGVRLEFPSGGRVAPVTAALPDGSLTLPSPGRFTVQSEDCVPLLDGRAVRCRVGAGEALMIADADWADPRTQGDRTIGLAVLTTATSTGELRVSATGGRVGWPQAAAADYATHMEQTSNERKTISEQTN